ncbi:hypothetical protein BFP70_02415 [Thioclava sp. SK-1]|uniref:DUF3168 domain-containing protein n=1 Tax=Thioclava sp. SK-1 TaxID=1889770 RepID=UPI000825828D|nr:DUF3168 domain-containing protein [Thioclava sp. SK-1]OCX67045.1 hypothetical protein BFP70_02415 [Thioclava sp. SK-1]
MSYGTSAALQAAVFQQLSTDPKINELVGGAVYDAAPPGQIGTYISLGPEDVRDASDSSGPGARHDFTVSVVTDAAGFQAAKTIAGAISDALVGADLPLTRGRLVGVWFVRAKAARVNKGATRRIDMTFRARLEG